MNKIKSILLSGSLLTFLGFSASAEELALGSKTPAVRGTDQSGKPVNLGEGTDKGYVLVYFYPKADTSGCTAQACSIRDNYEALTSKGVRVFGVSHDTVEAQEKFKSKYSLPFTLVADHESKVAAAFGVPTMAPLVPVFQREAFLFKDGVLVWRDLHAGTKTQADDVLKVIASKQ